MFQKIYIYQNPHNAKNVAIYFKVINPVNYSYSITFNLNEKQDKYFYQSNIEYIDQAQINNNCGAYDLCIIVLSIEVINLENYTPLLEVSRQIDNF